MVKENLCAGGRYLLAIDAIPDLHHLDYRILTRFASGLNFNKNFREYRYCYHEDMARHLGSNKKSITRAFNKILKLGWIEERKATPEECQQLHRSPKYAPNFYRLSEKVFQNYQEFLNRQEVTPCYSLVPLEVTGNPLEVTPSSLEVTGNPSRGNEMLPKAPVLAPSDPPSIYIPTQAPEAAAPGNKNSTASREGEPKAGEKKKKKQGSIKATARNFAERMKKETGREFYDFNLAVDIVEEVTESISCSLGTFTMEFEELLAWEGLSSHLDVKNASSGVLMQKLKEWIRDKEKILHDYNHSKTIPMKKKGESSFGDGWQREGETDEEYIERICSNKY